MESDFFAYMYRLKYIERWSLMRNTTRESVAEHSFHVGLLAHILCEIGNKVFGRSLNADRAAAMALFHDATEVFTGDIPTPVKHHNPKMLASFREIEAMAAERLHNMVPEPLRPAYAPLLGIESGVYAANAADAAADNAATEAELAAVRADQELRAMLKAADLLDAYLKCVTEAASGNREFAVAKTEIEQKLALLGMPEVDWFLDRLAPGLGRTLDELSRDG